MKQLLGRAALVHEWNIKELQQQTQLDLLVKDEGTKQEVLRALGDETSGEPRKVRCFRALVERLKADGVAGTTRLWDATASELKHADLRCKSPHDFPVEGKVWKFQLALSVSAGGELREALSDLAASGGSERVLARHPQAYLGPVCEEIAERIGKGKGVKGKKGGKDGKKGKPGKGAKNAKNGNGKGCGGGGAALPRPPAAPAATVSGVSSGSGAGNSAGTAPLRT
jgi:hypothetical protein